MSKILVVDDNLDILMILRVTFESAEHAVVSTEDPLEALPLIERERPDAVILDVMMPKKSGWDLLEEIRARPEMQTLPVVLLTALSEVDDRVRGLRGGADDYQVKPFEPAEILARVEGLIARRRPREAAVVDQSAAAPPAADALAAALFSLERRLAAHEGLDDLHLGRYQVVELLGRGAMGTVLRCFDPKLKRSVALKAIRLDTESVPQKKRVSRLLDEAVASAHFKHPHIVTIHDVIDEGDAAFIAMELVEGTNLESHLAACGEIEPPRLIPLAAAVAQALAAAHGGGLLHRDVKPGNVLLGRDNAVKVTDFGISESLSKGTPSGRIFGTPGYLAPEFYQDKSATPSPASDLFSLGVMLWECLNGRHPFVEKNWRRTLYNTAFREVQPIGELVGDLAPPVAELIDRMLEKHPGKRPADATAVAQVFEEIAAAEDFAWSLGDPPPLAPDERRSSTPSRLLPLSQLRYEAQLA